MRPSHILFIVLLFLMTIDGVLYFHAGQMNKATEEKRAVETVAVGGLGLTDLCVATEARYTRNPAVSDPMAPFMDHPGAIEHFPTGSVWSPPTNLIKP